MNQKYARVNEASMKTLDINDPTFNQENFNFFSSCENFSNQVFSNIIRKNLAGDEGLIEFREPRYNNVMKWWLKKNYGYDPTDETHGNTDQYIINNNIDLTTFNIDTELQNWHDSVSSLLLEVFNHTEALMFLNDNAIDWFEEVV